MWDETTARFGHHPDPEIDACVEIERLQGLLYEARAGLVRAMDYRAATPEGLAIKGDIRDALRRTAGGGVGPHEGEYGIQGEAARHDHHATPGSDRCRDCGRDLRDEIHHRSGE